MDKAAEQLIAVYSRGRGYGKCRSCGARISWYETVGGKRMPFDGTPVPRRTEQHPDTHQLIEHMSADDVHWRTCPDADSWRRKR